MRKFISACVGVKETEKLISELNIEKSNVFNYFCAAFPNFFTYIVWVLKKAVAQKLTTLYFVSGEGYLLKAIAELVISHYKLPISCQYLYCAKECLAMASYDLTNDGEEAEIFKSGCGISPWVLMERTFLPEQDRENIFNDICFNSNNQHIVLTNRGRKRFVKRLLRSRLFKRLVNERSASLFPNAQGYFLQEGLGNGKNAAVVSLGYDTSMQHTINLILQISGVEVENLPLWFYYGAYSDKNSVADKYQCCYFKPYSPINLKAKYNRYIIDNFTAAPHREIIGYAKKLGIYSPIFRNEGNERMNDETKLLQRTILTAAKLICSKLEFESLKTRPMLKAAKKINRSLYYTPTRDEAEAFIDLKYYNEFSEYNKTPILPVSRIDKVTYGDIMREYSIGKRLHRHFYNKSLDCFTPCLFWGSGALTLSDVKFKSVYNRLLLWWSYLQY